MAVRTYKYWNNERQKDVLHKFRILKHNDGIHYKSIQFCGGCKHYETCKDPQVKNVSHDTNYCQYNPSRFEIKSQLQSQPLGLLAIRKMFDGRFVK